MDPAPAPHPSPGASRASPATGATVWPRAAQLALVINDDEPNSVEIGDYYAKARAIPARNIVHVKIPNRPRKLEPEQFRALKEQIDARLGPEVQAVLMVWTAPYAVGCNSLTSAYTLGYDAEQCAKPCGPGKPSAYFNALSGRPPSDYGMRLSMLRSGQAPKTVNHPRR